VPTNYEIANVCDLATPCPYCRGGLQNIPGLGWRACQYCITGYKVRNCTYCGGQGCAQCVGTMHSFFSEKMPSEPAILPDTPNRSFAGEKAPRPAEIVRSRVLPRR